MDKQENDCLVQKSVFVNQILRSIRLAQIAGDMEVEVLSD